MSKRQFIKTKYIKEVPTNQEVNKSADKYLAVDRSKKALFINNFIGGIAWGIGASIGASIIITILGFILGQLGFIPFLHPYTSQVLKFFPHKQ